MTINEGLSRTMLLMRDEVVDGVSDGQLLAALMGTRVALDADAANLSSHSAQTAFVTLANLLGRSGHQVFLLAPPTTLVGAQLPLQPGIMVEQLCTMGADMLPDFAFSVGQPQGEVDLVIAFGDSPVTVRGRRVLRLNAGAWSGRLAPNAELLRWRGDWWPLGAMAAATLAAAEAFKAAMRKLAPSFRNVERLTTVFADTDEMTFSLAPPDTPLVRELGQFDCVSGGAITSSLLYALARIPAVSGQGRVIEDDRSDISNLNRYPLLLRSRLKRLKAVDLEEQLGVGLRIKAVPLRYEASTLGSIGALAANVLVGVDDIPTRWAVQQASPKWLGIGATTHWSSMASFHLAGLGCARCLHPQDDPGNARIPTVAFVSFLAGLLTATYFLRHLAGQYVEVDRQSVFVLGFRTENAFWAEVPIRVDCPTCQGRTADASKIAAA